MYCKIPVVAYLPQIEIDTQETALEISLLLSISI